MDSQIVAVKSELNSELKSESSMTSAKSDDVLLGMWLSGKSKGTARVYKCAIANFFSLYQIGVREVKVEHLIGFKSQLELKGLSTNTIKLRVSAIKSLLSFAQKTGYVVYNAGSVIKGGKSASARIERMLEKSEVQQLLAVVTSERDKLLLELIYRLGLRVSEAVTLNMSDIYTRSGKTFVQVLGKGDKYRYLPLPEDLANRMSAIASNTTGVIFQSRYGNCLDPSQVHRNLKTYCQKAGLSDAISPHWLRHAHAVSALDAGCDIKLLSTSLGHSSIATTSIYLHSRPDHGSSDFVNI